MTSVSKTAKDALQAKYSAVQAGGYKPVGGPQAQDYETLLHTVASFLGATKRQTPLVNVGYTIRVAVVCQQIQSFVFFHQRQGAAVLQLLYLGAGLDVTGLWSLSLDAESSTEIHVVEVDTLEICAAKREALLKLGLVEATTDTSTNSSQPGSVVFLQGHRPSKHGSSSSSQSTYTLIATDLRDIASVRANLSFLRTNIPTLIVSEIVLTYLGDSECDALLQWCASSVSRHIGSYLMAWEPLSPQESNNVSSIEAYKRFYFSQFLAKLERGKAPGQQEHSNAFSPLGSSCREVEKRLQKFDFHRPCVAVAGVAAKGALKAGVELRTKKLFDEHAALALYLRSYALVCGFGSHADALLRHTQCPWAYDIPLQSIQMATCGDVWLTAVEVEDESQLRDLFAQTYQHIDNSSVRKMVKSALKTDLASTPTSIDRDSSIGSRFRALKGTFVVAIKRQQEGDNTVCPRRLLGGIGVRLCEPEEGPIRGKPRTYEIGRLFVDPDFRGGGIGRFTVGYTETGFHQ
jgi:hypothetical protein